MAPPLPEQGEGSSGEAPAEEERTALSERLPRSMRGYHRAATEDLVGELVAKQADLEREAAMLRDRVAGLDAELEGYRGQEQLVSKTLLAATSQAMAIREEARQEAELMLRKTEAQLGERTALNERLEHERADAARELARLRQLADEIQLGLAQFLTQALEQLRSEEELRAEQPEPADDEGTLARDLGAVLKTETSQLRPSGGEVVPPSPSA